MDMNSTFYVRNESQTPNWRLIDAKGQVLGRIATQIADMLRGKDKPTYTPHADAGDYVVVINAEHIVLTGNKWDGEIYDWYTGWMGGYKERTARQMHKNDPTCLVTLAVKRMLPKNKINRQIIRKLKVYAGAEHPHQAQLNTK
jgi:large subunit ribosomal protein L13